MAQAAKWFTVVLNTQLKIALISLGFIGFVAISWFSYRWYTVYQGQKTQKFLSECLEEYQKALDSESDIWSEVAFMNELGFKQANSSLKPFFLVMQAQALAQQQKVDEALALMQRAINMFDKHSPYKDYFEITRALIQLDAEDKAVRQHGFDQLKAIAADEQNIYRDNAWYHVGEQYWVMNDLQKAKEAWQKLMALSKTVFIDSPWVALAEQKLETI